VPRAALIVNPAASRVSAETTARVEAELAPVETFVAERPGAAADLAAVASREFDRIYVFAGDGGLNEVVNGIAGDVPVGVLPGGASSVAARALGLPRDPVACARRLARSEGVRLISLGRVTFSPAAEGAGSFTSRRFVFAAGIGLDAELVRAVDRLGRRRGRRRGDIAYAWMLARVLVGREGRLGPRLTVGTRHRAALVAVANCDPYSYFGPLPLRVAPEARFELGLDVVAPERLHAAQVPALAYSLLVRPRHAKWETVLHLHDVDEVRVECDAPTALQADGEDLGDAAEAIFEAERGALRVIV
jgi:diacylglycerol kinase family enzyme